MFKISLIIIAASCLSAYDRVNVIFEKDFFMDRRSFNTKMKYDFNHIKGVQECEQRNGTASIYNLDYDSVYVHYTVMCTR